MTVHALAYNNADTSVIAVNDFGGGMWCRQRGQSWEWRPNGSEGILFWRPAVRVQSGIPEFDDTNEIADLEWFLNQPHFAEDVFTVEDQRLLLGALLLAPIFPSRNTVRPVPVHLGGGKGRSYDGKTMSGKMIGAVWSGEGFEPTPVRRSGERGEEDLQLKLMNQPYVLQDNVDTELNWLNDFIATYATGARVTKRKLYHDTTVVHVDYRGRLTITSRDPRFRREDVASRLIAFRFNPITDDERKEEPELIRPVLERRGRIWGGILALAAKVQDALPMVQPPKLPGRLADFISFGWMVSVVRGKAEVREEMAPRIRAAQAGFVLDEEPLFEIISGLMAFGAVEEQRTSEFYNLVKATAKDMQYKHQGMLHPAQSESRRSKSFLRAGWTYRST